MLSLVFNSLSVNEPLRPDAQAKINDATHIAYLNSHNATWTVRGPPPIGARDTSDSAHKPYSSHTRAGRACVAPHARREIRIHVPPAIARAHK
eukprot:1727793-Prymnesium_polylepis.1